MKTMPYTTYDLRTQKLKFIGPKARTNCDHNNAITLGVRRLINGIPYVMAFNCSGIGATNAISREP